MYSDASVQRPQGLVNLVVDPMVDRGPRMDIIAIGIVTTSYCSRFRPTIGVSKLPLP